MKWSEESWQGGSQDEADIVKPPAPKAMRMIFGRTVLCHSCCKCSWWGRKDPGRKAEGNAFDRKAQTSWSKVPSKVTGKSWSKAGDQQRSIRRVMKSLHGNRGSEGQRQQVGDSTCAASVWHAVCRLCYSGKALLGWCSAVDKQLERIYIIHHKTMLWGNHSCQSKLFQGNRKYKS